MKRINSTFNRLEKPLLYPGFLEKAIISRICLVLSKNQIQKSLRHVVNNNNRYDVPLITLFDNNIVVFTSESSLYTDVLLIFPKHNSRCVFVAVILWFVIYVDWNALCVVV